MPVVDGCTCAVRVRRFHLQNVFIVRRVLEREVAQRAASAAAQAKAGTVQPQAGQRQLKRAIPRPQWIVFAWPSRLPKGVIPDLHLHLLVGGLACLAHWWEEMQAAAALACENKTYEFRARFPP